MLSASFTNVTAQDVEDLGLLQLQVFPAFSTDDDVNRIAAYLEGEGRGGLETVLDDINSELNLLQSVDVVFATWDEIGAMATANIDGRPPGAFFDRSGTEHIYLSYELLAEILRRVDGNVSAWYTNVVNVVLHEIGHALIEINDIDLPCRINIYLNIVVINL